MIFVSCPPSMKFSAEKKMDYPVLSSEQVQCCPMCIMAEQTLYSMYSMPNLVQHFVQHAKLGVILKFLLAELKPINTGPKQTNELGFVRWARKKCKIGNISWPQNKESKREETGSIGNK